MADTIATAGKKAWSTPVLGRPAVTLSDIALTRNGSPGDGGKGQNHKS